MARDVTLYVIADEDTSSREPAFPWRGVMSEACGSLIRYPSAVTEPHGSDRLFAVDGTITDAIRFRKK